MKHWLLYLSLLVVGCCAIIAVMCYNYYAPPPVRQPYPVTMHHDDTLRVAYIGDSWAAMHKAYDNQLARMIADSLHRPVKVLSFGIGGLTSKEIYDYLFDDPPMKAFMQQGFDYCFISAGINDTYKKMSTRYYLTSIKGILQFMQSNHIHPVLLEIPDYDIMKAYNRQKTMKKQLRRLSSLITGSPLDCRQEFRDALNQLNCKNLSIIPYKAWNSNFADNQRTLYVEDGMHLNKTGYNTLDSVIAAHITISASP